jgi:ligand-binding sensor domain-containing protein/serine phosphatase RsbU (regulator of sigma subunit)
MGWNQRGSKLTFLFRNILVLLFAGSSLCAQSQEIKFKHLTTDDGLSHSNVNCLMQDSRGFIWIGTADGLNLYDGRTFRVFKHNPADTLSLSHNLIRSIYEDRSGSIWICTFGGGLNQFDRRTETFKVYKHNPADPHSISSDRVTSVYEDQSGTLWVGLWGFGGLGKLDRTTGKFKTYKHDKSNPTSISSDFVASIYEDQTGTLWIGTADGLNKFDPTTERFQTFNRNLHVSRIHENLHGNSWLGTKYDGLYSFDRQTEAFTAYKHDPLDRQSLSSNSVNAILEDRFATLWICTSVMPEIPSSNNALNQFDRQTGKFKTHKYDADQSYSLSPGAVHAILEDRAGMLWIGTGAGGLNQWDRRVEKFKTVSIPKEKSKTWTSSAVNCMVEDSKGVFWIGNNSGLTRWDRAQNSFVTYQPTADGSYSLSGIRVRVIHEDKSGILWLGTYGNGLIRLDLQASKSEMFELNINFVWCLYEDKQGYLWIGTEGGGLTKLDMRTKKIVKVYEYDHKKPDGISHQRAYAIHEDRSGNLWVGTDGGGLNKFDRTTEKFKAYKYDPNNPFSLSHDNICSIHEDQSGTLWIGTNGGGLNRFDRTTEKFTWFRQEDGLASDVVLGILEDDHGNLWLSTYNGITKFTPPPDSLIGTKNKGRFRNYDVSDGLQSKEFLFGSYFKSKDGRMFFGGTKGFNEFHPDSVRDDPFVPPIVITGLRKFNKPVPLPWGLDHPTEWPLSYRDNFFSIEFASLSYSLSSQNEYAYKLEGFDQDWIQNGTKHEATYTNLDPGEYIFRVKGSNHDGVWNEEGTSIKITITPPPWKTWWAYSFYGIMVLGFLYGARQFELNRKLKNARLKESDLRAEAAEAHSRAAEAQSRVIQIENERRTQELEEARQLQLSMLPKEIPKLPNLDIAVYMKTATEVGGDYYDFHVGDDGTLTVVLGDATGHGLKAGHMVSTVKGLFNAYANNGQVSNALSEMSRCIKNMHLHRLSMCLLMARLEPPPTPSLPRRGTGGGWQGEGSGVRLKLSSAGMPPVLIHRQRAKTVEEVLIKGLPLGAMRNARYHECEIDLAKGDTVVFMSDGFPELVNETGEALGYERAAEIFAKACSSNFSSSIGRTEGSPYKASDVIKRSIGRTEGSPYKASDVIKRLNLAAANWTNGSLQGLKNLEGLVLADDMTFVVITVM